MRLVVITNAAAVRQVYRSAETLRICDVVSQLIFLLVKQLQPLCIRRRLQTFEVGPIMENLNEFDLMPNAYF